MGSPGAARTLAEQLRGWPDDRLSALLRDRPDLAVPAPQDSSQVASRAAVRSSLLRAMDGLDRLELGVLDALVVAGPCAPERLRALVYAAPDAVDRARERLVDLALVWESPEGLRALTAVAEGFVGGVAASGLRPVTPDASDPQPRMEALSAAARALLAHLDAHGGQGTSSARIPQSPAEATTPAEELLAHGLVLPRPGGIVALPGEIGLALRDGRTTLEPIDAIPSLATSARDRVLVERAAAGAGFEAVRRVELLLDRWGTHPPSALRSGGVGVRELKAAAALLHVEHPEAALLVEVASAAGLLSAGATPEGEAVWLPTEAFDTWLAAPTAMRWTRLVTAWSESSRLASLVGRRDGSGKAWNALAPELSSIYAVESRRMALEALADLPDGEVLAVGTGVASVVARVVWLRPRRPASRADQVATALDEAALLGVTALGGLSSAARHLLQGDVVGAATALDPLLPEPVDHVLIQADLTAVAPGPLEPALSRRLHLVADVESRGGATVYRFTAESVRRAFDAGWAATEIHTFLGSVSRTPVPQPLTYLVDDVARRFGTLRVGRVEAFLRAEDETALTELLHHPQAALLGLRRLAPTVLVTTTPIEVLLPRLRELGAAPAVEAADGSVHVARPDVLRARLPRERRAPGMAQARRSAQLAAVVAAVRAGDRASAMRPGRVAGVESPAAALAALREAAEAGGTVRIGYVDNQGATSERIVDPLTVDGGQLTAYDHRSEDTKTFAVHRITGVQPMAGGD